MNTEPLGIARKSIVPYPHIYVDNFFEIAKKAAIRDTFRRENFTTAVGGCPVSNIGAGSDVVLCSFGEIDVLSELVPRLDQLFSREIEEKFAELSSVYKSVQVLKKARFGYFHLTRNQIRTRINFHRDDDRASYQLVFFLGDSNDEGADTTELIQVNNPREFERTGYQQEMKITSFGRTNNGLLCFANTPVAYHGLSKTIKEERFTVAASIIHYECR